jgi:hypothetical protein
MHTVSYRPQVMSRSVICNAFKGKDDRNTAQPSGLLLLLHLVRANSEIQLTLDFTGGHC